MKLFFLVLTILSVQICQAQDDEQPFQIYISTPFVGVGLSGRPTEMTGGALTGILPLPIELRNHWYIIPEIMTVGFRNPALRDKRGFIFESYPRLNHVAFGFRVGKEFKSTVSQLSFRPSIGFNLLTITEPRIVRSGWLGPVYEDTRYQTYSIPVQLDIRFRLHPKEFTAFVLGLRWNENGRRPFGNLCVGMEINLSSLLKKSFFAPIWK